MNKSFVTSLVFIFSLSSYSALASEGEYWEVTSKMEMAGMPFPMPARTVKVCSAKDRDDVKKYNGDKDCQITDFKKSGNKISFNIRCNHDGEIMTGSAKFTSNADTAEGTLLMNGTMSGREMKMTMQQSSKRIGGSCDPDQIAKENEERINKTKREYEERRKKDCDTSAYDTAMWIDNSWKFLHNNQSCPPGNQKKQMCDAINKDAPRDVNIFVKVVDNKDLIDACGINVAATTKSICKTYNEKNSYQLDKYCPAEAKAYREAQRRRECEGRSFTAETRAEDIKKCLNKSNSANDDDSAPATQPARKGAKPSSESSGSSSGSTAGEVLEGAKKLKGLFGF